MEERHFEYVFDDHPDRNRITFEYSDTDQERLQVSIEGGEAVIAANRTGFLTLAKLCIQFALGSHDPGFHLHLRKDFGGDASEPDQLRLELIGDGENK